MAGTPEAVKNRSRVLYISQSSLSKTIARLEKDVGVQLFDRQGNFIKLNGYGAELLRTAGRILMLVDSEKRLLSEMSKGETGSVIVGSNINQFLDDLYEIFSISYPDVTLRIVSGSADDMQQKLLSRELYMVISTYKYASHEISLIPLFTESMGIIVSKAHPLAARKEVSIKELQNERFLINNSKNDRRNHTFVVCERAGFQPTGLQRRAGAARLIGAQSPL